MKKEFKTPQMSVISIKANDIICTSGYGNNPGSGNPQVTPAQGGDNPWSGGLN